VPEDWQGYSQARVRDDVRAVLDALKIQRAHIVGLSMGAFATLHFGFAYPERALSLTVAGGGTGAHPADYRRFQEDARRNAELMRREGMAGFAATYGHGPSRLQLQRKDPRGFAEFVRQLTEHSAAGSANTMQGYQGRRPSLYELTAEMARLELPVLLMTGDEDEPCLEASLLMKRAIRRAGLAIFPRSGHPINLEEPALFNQLLETFFHQVESGRWEARDARAAPASIYGPGGKP
jgi:pimeloyl-ACP methyl ester carboxylesterase